MPRWSIDRNKRLLDKGIEAIKKERSNWDIEAQNEILSLIGWNNSLKEICWMDKQTEYETLRGEIICSTQVVKNYRSLLYTIVVAALAFAFDKNEAILFWFHLLQ